MIDLRYANPNPNNPVTMWQSADFVQGPISNSPYTSNIPQSTPLECVYDSSLMTEDAWKLVRMLEYADNASAQEFSGHSRRPAEAATTDRFGSRMKANAAGDAAKPKIWSIASIIGEGDSSDARSSGTAFDGPAKVTSYNSPSSGELMDSCSYRPKQYGNDASLSAEFSDCRYLGVNNANRNRQQVDLDVNNSNHNRQQLNTQLIKRYDLEPSVEPLSELANQKIADGYCCKYIEELYHHGFYLYRCIHCHQRFSSVREVHRHQIVEHPFVKLN